MTDQRLSPVVAFLGTLVIGVVVPPVVAAAPSTYAKVVSGGIVALLVVSFALRFGRGWFTDGAIARFSRVLSILSLPWFALQFVTPAGLTFERSQILLGAVLLIAAAALIVASGVDRTLPMG